MAYDYTLMIKNALGEEFELSHDTENIIIEKVEGLDPPPVDVNTAYSPTDGTSFRSAHAQQRNIVLHLALVGDVEAQRLRLYKMFTPKKALTLYFANRLRDVKTVCYVESPEFDIYAKPERAVISLICPSPWLESAVSIDYEPGYEVPTFEPPFSIELDEPIPFSEVVDHPTSIIVNRGDAEVGLTAKITFTGEVAGLKLTNETTGDFFKLEYSFQSGDVLNLDTRSGKLAVKRTRSGSTLNLLQYITDGSRWVKLPVGVNRVGITAGSGLSYIAAEISVNLLYGGV
jgi:hypothetical protein